VYSLTARGVDFFAPSEPWLGSLAGSADLKYDAMRIALIANYAKRSARLRKLLRTAQKLSVIYVIYVSTIAPQML